ncbi:MAG TPA: S41 family peptidase [Prolixibacteraceae bacterium]
MKDKRFIISLIFIVFLLNGCISKADEVENLRVFAKAYGYVKYFHPADEAQQINWSKFSSYGAKKVEKCTTSGELVETLNSLFNPIAPSVRFSISANKPTYDLKMITPGNPLDYRLTYWQHQGVSMGMKMNNVYRSIRVNSGVNPRVEKIFDHQPEFGTIITKEIGNQIYCQVPLVLYRDDKNTYPAADTIALKKLKAEIDQFDDKLDVLSLRKGNVINVYNVIQHFYPYFDVVNVNWDKELTKALSRCFTDVSDKDHFITLEKFTAPLKDGHVYVNSSSLRLASPSITWEWIENKLVITHNLTSNPNIHIGDIVTQIDGVQAEKYFEEINSQISAGTKGWLNDRANRMSLLADRGSVMKLTINDKPIDINRTSDPYYMDRAIRVNEKPYRLIGDSIWYLNMDMIEMDTINKLLPQLEKCKAIICDARGYPKGNHEFITHLMQMDDTTTSWMQIPQIIYPDHEHVVGYYKANWIPMMKARKPYLGNKKIIYIIDGSAISYAESCLGYIEGYKLATLVGQPTAGTNGNINPFDLPGGYSISWTGMKVLKHDGSQHHGIGILPNIYVTKTIQGIKEGRDEFLDKAIEIARQK